MIAVSLTSERSLAVALRSKADLLELRTDYFSDRVLNRLIERSTLPVILTIKRPMTVTAHKAIRYIDIDYKTPIAVIRTLPRAIAIIQSYHDYKATPAFAKLDRIVKQIRSRDYIPKIATTIRTVDDLAVIARLQKTYGKRIIAIGMGELGVMTRLYNKSLLTFAALTKQTQTAPGQLTVGQLRCGMQLYGLIGDDIAQSLSPKLHNTWFRQNGQPHRYQLWQTHNFDRFMEVFQFFQLPGASVTKPFKKSVIKYCAQLDRHAQAIGAVNTLVRRGRNLTGYNTDWLGVQHTLSGTFKHKRVLILGSGGAAVAVAYAAQQGKAASIVILGHDDLPTTHSNFDVLINATPVAHRVLVPPTSLRKKIVMDCIYGKKTALLKAAAHYGAARTINGLPMLKFQAAEQFKLWKKTA